MASEKQIVRIKSMGRRKYRRTSDVLAEIHVYQGGLIGVCEMQPMLEIYGVRIQCRSFAMKIVIYDVPSNDEKRDHVESSQIRH